MLVEFDIRGTRRRAEATKINSKTVVVQLRGPTGKLQDVKRHIKKHNVVFLERK